MEFIFDNPEVLASKALEHQLYVPTWLLRVKLERMVRSKTGRIVLAEKDGKPIAVAIHDVFGQFMVYVSPEHRRKKLGTQLIQHLTQRFSLQKDTSFGGYGSTGSAAFWKEIGITMDI